MRLDPFLDPLAQRLLDLRTVSGTAWALRLTGTAAGVGALMSALGTPLLLENWGPGLLTGILLVGALAQLRSPDSDLGLLVPAVVVIAAIAQEELSSLRAAGTGVVLLVSHVAFALAATHPTFGEFDRGAWRLAGRALLPVLVAVAFAVALVAVLAGVELGPWMMVAGILAAIALVVIVLPRER